ncbi:MAG: pyridoxal phosphate-dependent aminotransferase [Halanaerobiales bacterium]|nr:pyridoxal phosphate-dependent aminotransferase [Halanaerobiales bacterium]
MELSKRAKKISASLTLAISAKANKLKADGEDVVSFGAGEPDFDTPEFICDAAREALEIGFTRYTAASGYDDLKEAVVDKLKRDNNLDYNKDQVIVSNGAKHSLFNTFQAILNPGDEVIIPVPYWLTYPETVKMGGGTPVFLETEEKEDFKINIDKLKDLINENTKALILNSPSNPTGSIYTKEELEEIAKVAVDNEIIVVSDEIYEKIVYDGNEHISIASLNKDIKKLTIVINGVSKAYAMTGWRIGYAAGPKEIIKVMSNIQSHATSNPNSIAQYASNQALRGDHSFMKVRKDKFAERRDYMYEKINSIDGLSCLKPGGAFYIMMNISEILNKSIDGNNVEDSFSFADNLLEYKKVAVIPGVAFGADDYIRLSYANSLENIKKGLKRIEEFINELE